jgi:hypothetical protein
MSWCNLLRGKIISSFYFEISKRENAPSIVAAETGNNKSKNREKTGETGNIDQTLCRIWHMFCNKPVLRAYSFAMFLQSQ